MCGIIGYSGKKQAAKILVEGLKRLEYRGYDSSGIAVTSGDCISAVKSVGKIESLQKKLKASAPVGTVGIGHTRWATHGAPSNENSHPHLSPDGRFAVVHNGIIENFAELKAELAQFGIVPRGETDSEVIACLLQHLFDGDAVSTIRRATQKMSGSYALGMLFSETPETVYAVRKDNPLIIGLGKNENFIVSDFAAALEYTREFAHLEHGEIAKISAHSVTVFDANGNRVQKTPFHVDWDITQAEKDGYPHFMLKEIYEQPKALAAAILPRIKDGQVLLAGFPVDDCAADIDRIDIVGCGSAYHAGIVGKSFIEKYCRIRACCALASEYIYSDPITDDRTLTVIVSQSGETADSLAALRVAKSKGSRTLAIVNVMQSSIAREADSVLYMNAGPEIAVATTKGYTTQVAILYLVGLALAKCRGTIATARYDELVKAISALPELTARQLKSEQNIFDCAETFADKKCVFFIGRGADYAASLEGALKLKEISYIHAEAYAAGELKHGTISLIEDGTATVALVTQSSLYPKMLSNIKAVQSRGGNVVAVASASNRKIGKTAARMLALPDCDDDVTPILSAVVLQLFAYRIAAKRGCDIDKPRNLAKSVTVE